MLGGTASAAPAQAEMDSEDAEVARLGLDGAPTLGVSISPMKSNEVMKMSPVQEPALARTSSSQKLAPGGNSKLNKFARAAPHTLPKGTVVLTKDTMDFELRQMATFNREIYEARVRERFLEESLTRKLYTQSIATRRHERLARQRSRTQERIVREFALGTPFLQTKAREAREKALDAEKRAASMPQFADTAAIQDHFVAAHLAARQLTPESRFAKPSTVKELAIRAKNEVPSTESLLNPRNQITSPLPPKEVLLPPWVAPKSAADANNPLQKAAAKALLSIVPDLFNIKRAADYDAERREEVRPDLPTVVKSHMRRKYGQEAAAEKLVALRFACVMHAKSIPRVAIFQSMMGWGPDGLTWDATKTKACLLLMLWLQPPADEATKVSKRFVSQDVARQMIEDNIALELKLSDVDAVLKHLQRKRLISGKGATRLAEEAVKVVLPPDVATATDAPVVDVDTLLLRWMGIWGSWEWKEDSQALVSILSKFQGGSPGGSKSPRKGKSKGTWKVATL